MPMAGETAVTTCSSGIRDARALLSEWRDKVKIGNATERIALNSVIAQLDEATSALFALQRELQREIEKHLNTPARRKQIMDYVNGTGHAQVLRALVKGDKSSQATLNALIEVVIDRTMESA